MLYKDGEKYFTQAPEVVNDLTTGGTTKALSAEQGKVLKNTIDNLPQGGHTIKNDSGTSQTQRDNLQFGGVYTHDDSTNNKTKVDIVREFQSVAEIEALTGEAQKGFQVVQDAEDYIPFTASENIFDNTNTSFTGDNVQDVLEEVDDKLTVESITPTINTTYLTTSGGITVCQKSGKLVICDFYYSIVANIPDSQPTLISDLPKPSQEGRYIFYRRDTTTGEHTAFRVALTSNGEIKYWYNNATLNSSGAICGTLTYFTN